MMPRAPSTPLSRYRIENEIPVYIQSWLIAHAVYRLLQRQKRRVRQL